MSELTTITQAAFARHLAAEQGLTLLEFGGPSCAPCKTLEPLLAQLGAEHPGLVAIFKVDAEADPDFAFAQGVRGLPTMLVFKGDQLVERLTGARSKDALLKLLHRHA